MRKIALVFSVVGCLWQFSSAQNGAFELGVIVGEPTGVSVKLWASELSAFDLAAAWSFVDPRFHVHADYLIHTRRLISVERGRLPLYTGFGGVIEAGEDLGLAVRVPLGITYLFETIPLSLFFEVAPQLELAPATDFDVDGGLGARFVF